MTDEDYIYEVDTYTINFTRRTIKYWGGRYRGDDYYNYLNFNSDKQFYEQATEIIKDSGRKEIRKGIIDLLNIKERF